MAAGATADRVGPIRSKPSRRSTAPVPLPLAPRLGATSQLVRGTPETFDAQLEAPAGQLVVVSFWGPQCLNCELVARDLPALLEALPPNVTLVMLEHHRERGRLRGARRNANGRAAPHAAHHELDLGLGCAVSVRVTEVAAHQRHAAARARLAGRAATIIHSSTGGAAVVSAATAGGALARRQREEEDDQGPTYGGGMVALPGPAARRGVRVAPVANAVHKPAPMTHWTTDDMPDLSRRVAVVTGANSGLGLDATRALAAKGATVVMGCRDTARAEAAAASVRAEVPHARLEVRPLDLASLASIARFAADVSAAHPAVDVLMNNAGVMALPRANTQDGFDVQLGVNHLGAFALTLRLLPALEAAPAARVVAVASNAHRLGRIDFDDLHGERRDRPWARYGQSKLANLLCTYELERRLRALGRRAIAVAAHPGYTDTNLMHVAPRMTRARLMGWVMRAGGVVLAMPAAQGTLPQLRAATDPTVRGGEYYGPDGLFELRGAPVKVDSSAASKDEAVARRLWEVSEALTGVTLR